MATLAVAFVLLVPSAPASATTLTSPTVIRMSAPFSTISWSTASTSVAGCAAQKILYPITWNATLGSVRDAQRVSASSCPVSSGGPNVNSSASIFVGLYVGWNFHVAHSGPHVLRADTDIAFNWAVRINASGSCPTTTYAYSWGNLTSGDCDAYAEMNDNGIWWIADNTNGSIFPGSNGLVPSPGVLVERRVYISYGCFNAGNGGACFSRNSSWIGPVQSSVQPPIRFPYVGWDNGTLNASHSYTFWWWGTADVQVRVHGWPHASALAVRQNLIPGPVVVFDSIVVR